MLFRKSLLTLSLVAGLCVPASAQVKLERKAQEGTSKSTEVSSRTEQKLTIAGMEIDSESDSRTVVKSTIGKRDDAGNLRVQEKIASLLVTIKAMGSEYLFDSANPDKESGGTFEMMRPLHKAMSRRTSTTVYGKDGKVAQVEYDQDILNDLPDNVRQLVKNELDPETAKKAANDELDRLPAEPVKKGDTWERTSKLNIGAGQSMTISTHYTYEGETEKDGRTLDRISTKVLSVDYALEPGSALGLTLKESALKPAESKGEILFDRQKGQIVSSSSSIKIVGDITFVVNGKELPSKLDLKMENGTQIRPEAGK